MEHSLKLRAQEWVEVRSEEEILKTLDAKGQLDGLPFMPEMFRFCGKRFRVFKRAHKTCDPPNGIKSRRMPATVHLEGLRCDGQAHGGCQAGCLIFWKEAWLKRINDGNALPGESVIGKTTQFADRTGCTKEGVSRGTRAPATPKNPDEPVYVCQSTQVPFATQPLDWWDVRQYVEDYTSGNVRLSQFLWAFLFFLFHNLSVAGFGLGSALRWIYDAFQKLRGGTPYPWRIGKIPMRGPTPSMKLDLQPGEWVHVKSYPKILATLNQDWRNRGMYFDGEMVPFCGGSFRVLRRVEQIIDEKTGTMMRFRNEAIILDDVMCQARYSKCRRFCPRSIYPYWREIWLERGDETGAGSLK